MLKSVLITGGAGFIGSALKSILYVVQKTA
jgi:nucleoside-diphosphate-sugar epimerase